MRHPARTTESSFAAISPAAEFQAFWLSGGRALAGMHVNLWDDGIDPIKEVVASGRVLDPDRLADPAVPLGDA